MRAIVFDRRIKSTKKPLLYMFYVKQPGNFPAHNFGVFEQN